MATILHNEKLLTLVLYLHLLVKEANKAAAMYIRFRVHVNTLKSASQGKYSVKPFQGP